MKSSGTEEDTSSLEALDEEEGLNSEAQDEDLDPKVLLRIQKISDILNQTNLNLNVFEKMLPAYRSERSGLTLSSDTSELSEIKIQNQNLASRVILLESKNEELEKSLLQSNSKVEELCLENTRLNLTNEDLKLEISDLRTNLERAEGKNISDSIKKSESVPGTELISQISSGQGCIRSREESKDLVSAFNQIKFLKQSRDSLKRKTKQLLRHYRRKREILQHRENQLIYQKSGLVKLQNLHQNFQSSHIVVLDYLGSELGIISRLVGLLLETEENEPVLEPCSSSNLSSWYSQIETLIHWTKQTLVSIALRFSQSSESRVSLINRKLLSLTRKRGGKSQDPGSKPLQSVSDSISQCTLSQETTLQSLVQDLDTGLGG